MFLFGLAIGVGIAVGEFFFLRKNPKYLRLDKLVKEKKDALLKSLS